MIEFLGTSTDMVLHEGTIRLLAALPPEVVGELVKSVMSYLLHGDSDAAYITCETTAEALFETIRPQLDDARATHEQPMGW